MYQIVIALVSRYLASLFCSSLLSPCFGPLMTFLCVEMTRLHKLLPHRRLRWDKGNRIAFGNDYGKLPVTRNPSEWSIATAGRTSVEFAWSTLGTYMAGPFYAGYIWAFRLGGSSFVLFTGWGRRVWDCVRGPSGLKLAVQCYSTRWMMLWDGRSGCFDEGSKQR
jgi:hypothetical protein